MRFLRAIFTIILLFGPFWFMWYLAFSDVIRLLNNINNDEYEESETTTGGKHNGNYTNSDTTTKN